MQALVNAWLVDDVECADGQRVGRRLDACADYDERFVSEPLLRLVLWREVALQQFVEDGAVRQLLLR